jgi:hypothetical protein
MCHRETAKGADIPRSYNRHTHFHARLHPLLPAPTSTTNRHQHRQPFLFALNSRKANRHANGTNPKSNRPSYKSKPAHSPTAPRQSVPTYSKSTNPRSRCSNTRQTRLHNSTRTSPRHCHPTPGKAIRYNNHTARSPIQENNRPALRTTSTTLATVNHIAD